jgi:hypothetical protein
VPEASTGLAADFSDKTSGPSPISSKFLFFLNLEIRDKEIKVEEDQRKRKIW